MPSVTQHLRIDVFPITQNELLRGVAAAPWQIVGVTPLPPRNRLVPGHWQPAAGGVGGEEGGGHGGSEARSTRSAAAAAAAVGFGGAGGRGARPSAYGALYSRRNLNKTASIAWRARDGVSKAVSTVSIAWRGPDGAGPSAV